MSNTIVTDGNWDVASAVGPALFSAPIQGVNADYLLEQEFWQNQATFAALALNTAHPDHPTYYLVDESPLRRAGNGAVCWTRRYAQVPAQHFELETFSYNFIGFYGLITNADILPGSHLVYSGRARFTQTVPLKITYDYFKSDGTVASVLGGLPIVQALIYYVSPTASTTNHATTELLWDSPPFDYPSAPSLSDYKAMITADASDQSSFSIISEASKITRWMGNIFRRENRRIKAI